MVNDDVNSVYAWADAVIEVPPDEIGLELVGAVVETELGGRLE